MAPRTARRAAPWLLRLLTAIAAVAAVAALALAAGDEGRAPAMRAAARAPAGADADCEATAVAPLVVPTTVPADWILTADRLALEYAAAMGWSDRCPVFSWSVLANADQVMGMNVDGFAEPESCRFSIAVAATVAPGRFCDVFVHERLHLVRQDRWHDPMPGSPLTPIVTGYAPCHPERTPPRAWLTRSAVRALIGRRLGPGWRIKVLEYRAGGDDMDATVRARRVLRRVPGGRVRVRERLYYVRERLSGAVTVHLDDSCVRTLRVLR